MTRQKYAGPEPRRGKPRDPRRYAFVDVLERHGGNLTKTARELGINRKTASRWWAAHREGQLLDTPSGN